MIDRKKHPPNPRGNPNIGKARKTGPRTKEGKMRSANNLPKAFTTGTHSRLLELQRASGCDTCSLGIVTRKRKIGGKEIETTTGPLCKYYKEGSKLCKLPLDEMAWKMKNYETIFRGDTTHALKTLAIDLLEDAKNAEVVETLNKGKTGFYTLENKKAAYNILMDLLKLDKPIKTENKNLNVNLNSEDFVSMDDLLGDEE